MTRKLIILTLVIIVLSAAISASGYLLNFFSQTEAIDLFTKASLLTAIFSATVIALSLLTRKKQK